MALPLILPAAARFLGRRGVLPSLTGIGGAVAGFAAGRVTAPGARRRRRRRAKLTHREMQELMFIKNTLGKTAAANALPFFLGRGG